MPLVKDDSQMYEYACHEGNYGIANILSAALKARNDAARAPALSDRGA